MIDLPAENDRALDFEITRNTVGVNGIDPARQDPQIQTLRLTNPKAQTPKS